MKENNLENTFNTGELIQDVSSIPTDSSSFSVEAILAEYGGSPDVTTVKDLNSAAPVEESDASSQKGRRSSHSGSGKSSRHKDKKKAEEKNTSEESEPQTMNEEDDSSILPDSPREIQFPRQTKPTITHISFVDDETNSLPDLSFVSQEDETDPEDVIVTKNPPAPIVTPPPASVQSFISQNVNALLEEDEEKKEKEKQKKERGFSFLFKRKEEFEHHAPTHEENEEDDANRWNPEPREAEDIFRSRDKVERRSFRWSLIIFVLLFAVHIPEMLGFEIPFLSGDTLIFNIIRLFLLVLLGLCGNGVFARAFQYLVEDGRLSIEFMSVLCSVAVAADTVLSFLQPENHTAAPLFLPAGATILFCAWGEMKKTRAFLSSSHSVTVGKAPYMVTSTNVGICKQHSRLNGFYHNLTEPDMITRTHKVILPIFLGLAVITALIATVLQDRPQDMLWSLSALLIAATGLSHPIIYGYTFDKIATRLKKGRHALAGGDGAELLDQYGKRIILTDTDLFPTGSIHLTGLHLFIEDYEKATTYAAAMASYGELGYSKVLLTIKDGKKITLPEVDSFDFYEDNGCAGQINGENILMGSESFLRSMHITIPDGVYAKTDVFLAVDRKLMASFSLRYVPNDKVYWALHALRRNHITPVLATRNSAINESLLSRKYGYNDKAYMPNLATRLALSKSTWARNGHVEALISREGLAPFAEVLIGARRMCHAMRTSGVLAFIGSIVSILLTFYFCLSQSYRFLTPVTFLLYIFLWCIPTIILAINASEY